MNVTAEKPKRRVAHYPDPDMRTIGSLNISPRMREVKVNGTPAVLTRMQFDILLLLASRPGWVYTRDRIVEAICGPNHVLCSRAVDVHMVHLRKRLGSAGTYIQTIRGVGYRLWCE